MRIIRSGIALALILCCLSCEGLFLQTSAVTDGELKLSAETCILTEAKTCIELWGKDTGKRMAPASTTKILTAIIAIENMALDSQLTVSKAAANVIGSQIGLLEGDRLSLEDLLYFLMLKSANDAAVVIAEGIADSTDAFALMMNEKAKDLGCENSCFANPHGLPDDGHYTTARDLATITSYAMQNEIFRTVVSAKTYKAEYRSLVIANSNKLLHTYDFIRGVKTGYTKAAGRCLVSYAEKDGCSLIAVTMNAPDDWNDHIKLYDEGFSRVSATVLFDTDTYKCVRSVLNGNTPAYLFNSRPIYGLIVDGNEI